MALLIGVQCVKGTKYIESSIVKIIMTIQIHHIKIQQKKKIVKVFIAHCVKVIIYIDKFMIGLLGDES